MASSAVHDRLRPSFEAETSSSASRKPGPSALNLGNSGRDKNAALGEDEEEREPLLLSPPMPRPRSPFSVEIDQPSTPTIAQRAYLSHPVTSTEQYYYNLPVTPHGKPAFFAESRSQPPQPTLKSRAKLLVNQIWTNSLSAYFLVLIVITALASQAWAYVTGRGRSKAPPHRPWDNPDKWKHEHLVKDPGHYAENCGFRIVDQTVETQDGYYLRVHKVIQPGKEDSHTRSDGRGGYPVVIQHGLFQTSGSFVTSEERSLAFWLAEHGGYQVYLSNNRAVFDMGHRNLSRSDPRFWDYNIRELALFDVPAVIEHVKKETGYSQVAFIGHSQGNATMFCTLAKGMLPSLGASLSNFIALAPAVYAGPLTNGFLFSSIKSLDWKTWKRLFGVLDFIPIMRWAYDWVPGYPFGLLGARMFSYLFNWTDKNWVCFTLHDNGRELCLTHLVQLKRRKPKMFRFTPSPVSSAGIFWWTGKNGFSSRGCVLDDKVEKWYDDNFPPLSLYAGNHDYLVLLDPLLERLKSQEKEVRLMRVHRMEDGEHCDMFWHADAPELVFHMILEDIEKTRQRYPQELLVHDVDQ